MIVLTGFRRHCHCENRVRPAKSIFMASRKADKRELSLILGKSMDKGVSGPKGSHDLAVVIQS